jgi:hypothetical protein
MEIFVNNQAIQFTPQFPLTWGKFFEAILHAHIPRNHGVVRVVVNGQEDFSVMTAKAIQPMPEDIRVLELYTKDLLSITRDGFVKSSALIEAIKADIDRAVGLLRSGDMENASHRIISLMEAIKPLVNFINSIGMSFSLNFDELRYDDEFTLRQKIETFVQSLQDVIHAQEKKDLVELADFLEYQLKADMDIWTVVCERLLQEIDRLSAPVN